MQKATYIDLGKIGYKQAWDLQEDLLQKNLAIKAQAKSADPDYNPKSTETKNYLLFCEHNPVYTLGKSGHMSNVLISDAEMAQKGIEFFKTNRGGDITFHGLGQVVGYPVFDLEKFYTDIGKYLRNLEQVIIDTIAHYGLKGSRSSGETGVWLDPDIPGSERKICAMGVRCSRWVTMHGFALNANTDLGYFNHIIPCGIQQKQVTSIAKEIGKEVDMEELRQLLKQHFSQIFELEIRP